jgi:hypothetical protein
MTRNREIELKAEQNTTNQLELEGYIKGAKWADQHPRKGLWDAEKVIEWLKKNCTYTHPRKGTEECFINLFALKDAMED